MVEVDVNSTIRDVPLTFSAQQQLTDLVSTFASPLATDLFPIKDKRISDITNVQYEAVMVSFDSGGPGATNELRHRNVSVPVINPKNAISVGPIFSFITLDPTLYFRFHVFPRHTRDGFVTYDIFTNYSDNASAGTKTLTVVTTTVPPEDLSANYPQITTDAITTQILQRSVDGIPVYDTFILDTTP